MTALLLPLALLAMATPNPAAAGNVYLGPGRLLDDTNAFVCPPAASGCVGHDGHTGRYTKYPGTISYGVYDPRYFSAHGYAAFDLSGFPDSTSVVAVQLLYYQYEHGSLGGSGLPATAIVLIPDANASAQQLFADIGSGTVVDPVRLTDDGWVVRSFNEQGVQAVDSCIRVSERLDLGVAGGGCPQGAAYGVGRYHPLRAYLRIAYATSVNHIDIVGVEAKLESYPLAVGDSVVLRGRFANVGSRSAYDFWVLSSINGAPLDSELVSLMSGETLSVRATMRPVQQPGSIELLMCSKAPADWCAHNDTAITTGYVFPAGTKSVECFELEQTPTFPPAGWVVCNGGSAETWQRAGPGDRYAHSGGYYARCERTEQTDDWLVTYGLCPNSTTADTVGVYISAPYSWCFPQVWALGSQNPNDILGLLLDTTITTQGWCEKHISLDQFDGCEVYVGFRNYATSGGPQCLDDVWFTSERVPAVEEPAKGGVPGVRLRLGQNPVARGVAIIEYEMSTPGPVLVEVTDALGRTVARQQLSPVRCRGQVSIGTAEWPAGVYFARLTVGTASASTKCVVQRSHP